MSRIKQRIPLFLSRLNIEALVLKLWHTTEDREDRDYQLDLQGIKDYISSPLLEDLWTNNPDLRFGQLMVNEGFNIFDAIYHLEESDILNQYCGLSRPESHIWDSNYNEDGSEWERTIYRFIDELDDKHLSTMVDEANQGMRYYNPVMVDIFVEELHRRGFINYKLTDEGREKMRSMGDEIQYRRVIELQQYLRNINEQRRDMSKLSIKTIQNDSYHIAVGLVGDVGYLSITDNGLYPDGDSRTYRRDMGFNNFMVPLMTRDKLKELRNIIKQVLKESK